MRIPRHRSNIRLQWGWTLVEMMAAVLLSTIVLAAIMTTFLIASKSMKAIGNYNDLNRASRFTLDQLSRDVRNAAYVTNTTSSQMTLVNLFKTSPVTISYSYDGVSLTRTAYGSSRVMLTNCDQFTLQYFSRIPTNDLTFVNTTNLLSTNAVKLISVSWRCSRTIMGTKFNTESVQTAKIAIRN